MWLHVTGQFSYHYNIYLAKHSFLLQLKILYIFILTYIAKLNNKTFKFILGLLKI